MFKNRSIQMKIVKDATQAEDATEVDFVDPEQLARIATDYTIKTIGALGVAIAANRVLKTICEVVLITAHAKIK